VLVVLAGIGYWGHHTGWDVPKFSELIGNANGEGTPWCTEHSVPESICVACRADLMPKAQLHGWCKEHGVAECVLDHPEISQNKRTLSDLRADHDRAHRALQLRERPQNDPTCTLHLRRIQFASRQAAEKAGIDITRVDRGPVVETIAANGRITYDPTRVTRLAARLAGTVWQVQANVGDQVRPGDVLALIDAAAVGQAKAELLQAAARLDLHTKTNRRLTQLGDVVGAGRIQETEAAVAEARAGMNRAIQSLVNLGLPITLEEVQGTGSEQLAEKVHFLGIPPRMTERVDPRRTTANLIPVVTPRHGVVVARDAVAGEVIDTTKTLFTVVDTSRMWLLLDVPLEDVQYVRLGQPAHFSPDGDLHAHTGHVTWISTEVDHVTRTVKVRAELSNKNGDLRHESFGAGHITLREETDAVVVSREAIHWEGCCHVAFVRDKKYLDDGSYKVFHTRMVRPGVTHEGYTEVIAGLLPGEVVVATGGGLLRAELLKGNLGAG
jgi:cobalt-zinc-cadmium efflux system membrane fusion protein